MKQKFLIPIMAMVALLITTGMNYFVQPIDIVSTANETVSTAVLVKFKTGLISHEKLRHSVDEVNLTEMSYVFKRYGVTNMSAVFKNRYDKNGNLKISLAKNNLMHLENWQRIELSSKDIAKNFLLALKKSKYVETVQLDEPIKLISAAMPNDPYFNGTKAQQWHLDDGFPVGQSFDIDAPKAWDINKGRNDVIIAVLDGGVDYGNKDLDTGDRTRVIAGKDIADVDNDPIDDLPAPSAGAESFANHGTPIAGIIGAITDNRDQTAGIMWNCKIMPIKIVGTRAIGFNVFGVFDGSLDFSNTARPSDIINGLDYAVNNGVSIINLSFGFYDKGFPIADVFQRVPAYAQAVKNAYLNNVVVTASMGNDNTSERLYPAGFDELVIPVGASDMNGVKASFSNTGSHISVVAPGVQIYSTSRRSTSSAPITFQGTSFSAPIVAAVAGLIISQAKDRGFNVTNNDVKHIIELTSQDTEIAGFDNRTGYGIVNANNALTLLAPPNVLYQYSVTGGTASKIKNLKWIILDGRWGLAAALYPSVDEYQITKHIDFPVPFCSPPKVWIRERECTSLDYGNPNLGRPNAFIKNITATGFDLDYAAYYVIYDLQGRQINQWIPTDPTKTVVAYTVVGQPSPAAISGPINSVSTICNSQQFTLAKPQPNTSVVWSSSNPSCLSINANTGLATRVNSCNGQVTVTATIRGACGSASVSQDVRVDALYTLSTTASISGPSLICTNGLFTIQNQPVGSTVSWSSSYPTGLSINANTGLATRVNDFIGQATVTATVSNAIGCSAKVSKDVWVGIPIFSSVASNGVQVDFGGVYANPYYVGSWNTVTIASSGLSYPSNFNFALSSLLFTNGNTNGQLTYNFLTKYNNNSINLQFTASNLCGTNSGNIYFCNINCDGRAIVSAANAFPTPTTETNSSNATPQLTPSIHVSTPSNIAIHNTYSAKISPQVESAQLSIFPNPATHTLTVQMTDSTATESAFTDRLSGSYQLQLYDLLGKPAYSMQSDEAMVHLPVHGLPSGLYYLTVAYKDAVLRKQIIISR